MDAASVDVTATETTELLEGSVAIELRPDSSMIVLNFCEMNRSCSCCRQIVYMSHMSSVLLTEYTVPIEIRLFFVCEKRLGRIRTTKLNFNKIQYGNIFVQVNVESNHILSSIEHLQFVGMIT